MSDSLYARPGSVFYSEYTNAPAGLVGTVGVQIIRKSDRAVVSARTTAGIVESPAGSGTYRASLTAPDSKGAYSVFWDDGEVTPATVGEDDLVVTFDPPPAPESGEADFSYDPSLSDLVSQSRFEIGDTVESGLLFTDTEIRAVLADHSDEPLAAAAALCDQLATRFAGDYDVEIDGQSMKRSQRAIAYEKRAAALRLRSSAGGGLSVVQTERRRRGC